MALSLQERLRAGVGNGADWLQDRTSDLANRAAEAEAQARAFYGRTRQGVQNAIGRTTAQIEDYVRRPSTPQTSSAKGLKGARSVADTAVRQVAPNVARAAGNGVGAVTGAITMGRNLADDAKFIARLLNPADSFLHERGDAAWDHLFSGVAAASDAVVKAAADPVGAVRAIGDKSVEVAEDVVPQMTPQEPTLSAEVRRNFDIGRNQGELAVEVAPYLVGAGEIKALSGIGRLSTASRISKYEKQGFSPKDAAYLALLYRGAGHHSPLPQRATLPGWMGGGKVPKSILESRFNKVSPPGISRGDFYERHYRVDDHFHGAGLKRGRPGWSGKRLGLERYDGLDRVWYGTPNATKQAAAGIGITATIPLGGGTQP